MIVAEVVDTVNRVAMQYPQVRGITVDSEPFPNAAYAGATDGKIVVNDLYASDLGMVERMIEDDIRLKFHPPLGHCSAVEFLAYHEAAHIIDRVDGRAAHVLLTLTYGDGNSLRNDLSGYSFGPFGLNYAEALAEAFAAVHCNGGNRYEQALYGMLVG